MAQDEESPVRGRASNESSGATRKKPTTIVRLTPDERDQDTLRRLGKKPVLKRNFGFISILGFSATILISWETVLTTMNFGLLNGGPGGMVYQYIFIWLGVMLSFVIITEMASMAPTSGGQYHWVSILAPPGTHNFLSYITGWMTVCGWQANTASGAYLAAGLITGMASVSNPDYTPETWHTLLVSWAVTAFAVFINMRGGTTLPRFEAAMLLLHMFGFLVVIIPLLTLSPKRDKDFVFTEFLNGGEFPTFGLSFMVGTLGMLWTFSGADGAIHMSEEVENAALVVPWSILTTYLLNGVLGFGILIAILYCTADVEAALKSTTNFPFMEIILTATGSRGLATGLIAIPAVMEICATTSSFASATRQFWAFSRDHGVPGWSLWVKLEKKTSVPIYAVFLTAAISVLLPLISLGSYVAFEDLVTLALAGLYSSYFLATTLLLYRRLTGTIHVHNTSNSEFTNTVGAILVWGPWHVPGWIGTILNFFVCCFLGMAFFFSFWPSTMAVDASTMNWNAALWGGIVIISLLYYAIEGRKSYSGPIIEIDDPAVVLTNKTPDSDETKVSDETKESDETRKDSTS